MVENARTRTLGVALQAFGEIGYDAVSVAEIRARAGVSNGSFFHHFGSKEGLAAALFLDGIERYQADVLRHLHGAAQDARAGIAALIEGHLRWVEDNRPMARFLFEQSGPAWSDPVAAKLAAANARFFGAIDGWRRPLVRAGALADVPGAVFFALLIGPAQVLCRGWLTGQLDRGPADYAGDLIAAAQAALCLD